MKNNRKNRKMLQRAANRASLFGANGKLTFIVRKGKIVRATRLIGSIHIQGLFARKASKSIAIKKALGQKEGKRNKKRIGD